MNDTDFTQRDSSEARASRNLDFRYCREEKAANAIRHLEKAKRYDVVFYLIYCYLLNLPSFDFE